MFAISLLHGLGRPRPVIRLSGPVNCQIEQGSVDMFDSIIQLAQGNEGGLDAVVRAMLDCGGELV